MTLKEFIKTNKINADTFLAIHNKDDKWVICGLRDDVRLVGYLDLEVLSSEKKSANIIIVKTNYDKVMQIAHYKMKAEQAERAAEENKSKRKRK